jgi:hypothetical protein
MILIQYAVAGLPPLRLRSRCYLGCSLMGVSSLACRQADAPRRGCRHLIVGDAAHAVAVMTFGVSADEERDAALVGQALFGECRIAVQDRGVSGCENPVGRSAVNAVRRSPVRRQRAR